MKSLYHTFQILNTKSAGIYDEGFAGAMEKDAEEVQLGPSGTADDATAALFRDVRERLRTGETNVPVRSTVLRRHAVPVADLSRQNLHSAGFVPSYVAVPERGQTSYLTYRHPFNNLHIHRHGDQWLFHEDSWPALSMAIARWKHDNPDASLRDAGKAILPLLSESVSHGALEGVPGWLTHIRGTILGEGGFRIPGRTIEAQPPAVQVLRGAAASGLAGLAARGILRKPGIGRSTAAVTAGALSGSVLAAELHQALHNRGYASPHPTLPSAALQIGAPIAGGVAGWMATRRYRKNPDKEDEVDSTGDRDHLK